jgi:hypothetical protein
LKEDRLVSQYDVKLISRFHFDCLIPSPMAIEWNGYNTTFDESISDFFPPNY